MHVFIPVSLKLLPSLFSVFVQWLCRTILHMENKYSQGFPENAIAFTDTVTTLLKVESDCDISKEINELATLCDGLKQLKILKDDFGISVALRDYLKVRKG